jgi:hypothetical protein
MVLTAFIRIIDHRYVHAIHAKNCVTARKIVLEQMCVTAQKMVSTAFILMTEQRYFHAIYAKNCVIAQKLCRSAKNCVIAQIWCQLLSYL